MNTKDSFDINSIRLKDQEGNYLNQTDKYNRKRASYEILEILYNNRDRELTVNDIRELTGFNLSCSIILKRIKVVIDNGYAIKVGYIPNVGGLYKWAMDSGV